MQSAVLEFDEAIQVPWRPPLAVVSGTGRVPRLRPATPASRPAGSTSPASSPSPSPGNTTRPVRSGSRPVPPRSPADLGPADVRLTRRGRWLLVALALAVGIAVGALLSSWLGGAQGQLRLASDSSVVVRPGDTLWSIATSVADTDDVRGVVDRIQSLNHLSGTSLQPGQVLQLP